MTDDIEARLRAALHAYADQVDDPGTDLPDVPGATERVGAVRRWRAAVLVAAAVVAVIGGIVWVGASRPGQDVVADQAVEDASPRVAESAPDSADDDAALSSPEGYASAAVPDSALPAAPEVGVPYALDLYTHCGVLGTDVGGRWFAADPPLVEDNNPPEGWGNPYQLGTLLLTSSEEAVFTDDLGHEVLLRAAPESARPAPCA